MLRKQFMLVLMVFCAISINAQSSLWTKSNQSKSSIQKSATRTMPLAFESFSLNMDEMKKVLAQAPNNGLTGLRTGSVELELPMPDGTIESFQIVEASIFHPDLAKKYPQIKQYAGTSKKDRSAYLRLGISQKGFHAMILSSKHSSVYIDKIGDEEETYMSYYRKDYPSRKNAMQCGVTDDPTDIVESLSESHNNFRIGDCQLRTYRLALACTGEYATFHGGTIPDVLAAYAVSMARVNGIYERDATVTMQLIANTDQVIFLDSNTDPFTNGSGGAMLGENQAELDATIGTDNYDIGHVFSTGGGGIASLRSPCNSNRKAQGVTGQSQPVGDPFDIDYVAHEMGHQFGGNHTQNNSCNRNGNTAVEPGSASTIMGYAGICPPNVQSNSDDHFHVVSINEIADFVTGNGNSCAQVTDIDNNPPELISNEVMIYAIPASTPFRLTAEASDPDGDFLTYCWEQTDNEVADMPPVSTNTGGPAFRSLSPMDVPVRYFPNLNSLSSNTPATWEVLPSVERIMNFSCTVRDNAPLGGCTAEQKVLINVIETAEPFTVTFPNEAGLEWNAGDSKTITWNVGGTDMSPIDCANVDILLSTDGGLTFPITLASSIPNTGSFEIPVPDMQTNQARIMVVCSDNIFFDISDFDFSLVAPFSVNVSPQSIEVCADDPVEYVINISAFEGFNGDVTLSAVDLPDMATANFSSTTVTPPADVTLSIENINYNNPGEFLIQINSTDGDIINTDLVTLIVSNNNIINPILMLPSDGMTGVNTNAQLIWGEATGAIDYTVELSTSPNFDENLISQMTTDEVININNLDPSTVYYWRVKSSNECSESNYGSFFAFQTDNKQCMDYMYTDGPLAISENDVGTYTATISVGDNFAISEISTSLMMEHSWVGDVAIDLVAPDLSVYALFDQPGVPESNYGCGNNDADLSFSDDAVGASEELEMQCEDGDYALTGAFQPITPFATLNNTSSLGDWSLMITDNFDQDGGALTSWNLNICYSVPISSPSVTNNKVLPVEENNAELITDQFLSIDDPMPAAVRYLMTSFPSFGTVQKMNMTTMEFDNIVFGEEFTQEDINLGYVRYNNQFGGDMDQFDFNITGSDGGWLPAQRFNILVLKPQLSALADVVENVDCNGEATGALEAQAFGGEAPYTYSLDDVEYQDSGMFADLPAGFYTVFIKDALDDIVQSNEVEITEPDAIVPVANVNNNIITASASGGVMPYTYSLDNVTYSDNNVFTDLPNDFYTVYIKDANDCVASVEASVLVPPIIAVNTSKEDILCNGDDDGSIEILDVTGGLAPYKYSLNDGPFETTTLFTDLPAGMYTIDVNDDSGMEFQVTLEITEPDAIEASVAIVLNDITVSGSGGTGNLEYSLDNEDNYSDETEYTKLTLGSHTIFVRDENGCVVTVDFEIIESSIIDIEKEHVIFVNPNPSSGIFNIETEENNGKLYRLEVYNILGQQVLQETNVTLNNGHQIELTEKGNGTYFILISDGVQTFRKNIIKVD